MIVGSVQFSGLGGSWGDKMDDAGTLDSSQGA
jgi:hypothetical protein